MKIKVSFFGLLMIISLVLTHSYLSLAALLAAFLHELGHILSAKLCKIPLEELKLDIFGAAITPKRGIYSYKNELCLAAAGPLVNLAIGGALIFLLKDINGFFELFISASLFLGIFNLLPLEGFDGYRILHCTLCNKFSFDSSIKICNFLSFFISLFMWLLSVYLMLRLGASLSLFVFSYAFLCKILVRAKSYD